MTFIDAIKIIKGNKKGDKKEATDTLCEEATKMFVENNTLKRIIQKDEAKNNALVDVIVSFSFNKINDENKELQNGMNAYYKEIAQEIEKQEIVKEVKENA